MAISLYDVSALSFRAVLAGVAGYLEKSRAHAVAQGMSLDELVDTRLHADMWPLRMQVIAVAQHSIGALRAAEAGVFTPPRPADLDYAGLQGLIADGRKELEGFTRERVEALEGRDMEFRLGPNSMPFKVEDFFMSFSLPNLHFHATTAYDILRMKGVPLGKRDYIAELRIKR